MDELLEALKACEFVFCLIVGIICLLAICPMVGAGVPALQVGIAVLAGFLLLWRAKGVLDKPVS